MWLAWSVPLMAVGVAIAVMPVLWGSVHVHRADLREARAAVRAAERRELLPAPLSVEVGCPLCEVSIDASSHDELVDRVCRHAWRTHGIPSRDHILESLLVN